MLKTLLTLISVLALITITDAQNRVEGTVINQSGSGISGVLVVEKGSINYALTNDEGFYSIIVAPHASLVFSYLGMETVEQRINRQSTLDIKMRISPSDEVVTALGRQRAAAELNSNQQVVMGEVLVKSKDINLINSMSGRIAGVNVKKNAAGAGGSTRLILRGDKSIIGDSEPLYVIDGIPMANNKGRQPGMWGGIDHGDGLSQINPEDIESITVLNGFNASAIYGAKGANGVVMLTTRNGTNNGTNVRINSGVTFENVMDLPQMQYRYGSDDDIRKSWSYTKGNYDDTFVEDYFETSVNYLNSVSVSGGNDKTSAYFSYANTNVGGLTPNNKYLKNNVSFKQSTKLFDDKLSVGSNIILASERIENQNPAGYYLNPLTGLYLFPRAGAGGNNMAYYRDNYEYFREDRNMFWQNWFVQDHFQSNPYWISNREPKEYRTYRVIGALTASLKMNEHLDVNLRTSYDYTGQRNEEKHFAGSNTTNVHENGSWVYQKYSDELLYADATINYKNGFGNWKLDIYAGLNFQKNTYGLGELVNTGLDGLLYPNEFYFQNLPAAVRVHSTLFSKRREVGSFANVTLGFKNYVFIDFAARNDWNKNLLSDNETSNFYPSIGLTSLISEQLKLPSWVSLLKLRASYTQGANTAPVYALNHQLNQVYFNNPELAADNPEKLKSFEVGTNFSLWNNRMGVDFTYYKLNSKGENLLVPTTIHSRNKLFGVESSEIVNKGVELSVWAQVIRGKQLSWETRLNYSNNNNKVNEFESELNRIDLGASEGYSARIRAGGSVGDLFVYKFQRNQEGKILFNDAGLPMRTQKKEFVGNLNADWGLGWSNTISYGNFDLSFLINAQVGGKVFSQTEAMLDGYGVSERSAIDRDIGFVSVDGVKVSSGERLTEVDPKSWYSAVGNRNGIGEAYVYNRTNIRLGQFSLSYTFHLSGGNLLIDAISCSLVGQNLFFLYLEAPYDPELLMNTNRNWQSLDNFNMPATRTIGFNVKLDF